jgi:hypothetical protein
MGLEVQLPVLIQRLEAQILLLVLGVTILPTTVLAQALGVPLPGWAQMPQGLIGQPPGLVLGIPPLVVALVLGVRLPERVQLQVARILVIAQGLEAQLVEILPLVVAQ